MQVDDWARELAGIGGRWATIVRRLFGDAGSRAVAKVFNLVLAAIGVTFVRHGVLSALGRE